jgi:hypothetical protein
MADDLRERLGKLVTKWRIDADEASIGIYLDECADQLEAELAVEPPAPAALGEKREAKMSMRNAGGIDDCMDDGAQGLRGTVGATRNRAAEILEIALEWYAREHEGKVPYWVRVGRAVLDQNDAALPVQREAALRELDEVIEWLLGLDADVQADKLRAVREALAASPLVPREGRE